MTTPDIANLCEKLRDSVRDTGYMGIEHGCQTCSLAGLLNDEAADTLERQAAERDALRLAILGGEDVPGVAATVSIDQCIRFLTEERQRNEWSAEQQAKLERQAAEIERLRGALEAKADEGMLVLETLAKMTPDRAHRHVRDGLAIAREARAALTGEDPGGTG
jgi:hypothetical protein